MAPYYRTQSLICRTDVMDASQVVIAVAVTVMAVAKCIQSILANHTEQNEQPLQLDVEMRLEFS